jgi:TPR repeat protein
MYYIGEGVAKNDVMAIKYYQLAADQGLAYAQYNLGRMYANGEGVAKNDAMAFKYYQLAADQGLAYAQYSLGLMYYYGYGMAADYVIAYKWVLLSGSSVDFIWQVMKPEQVVQGQAMAAAFKPKTREESRVLP